MLFTKKTKMVFLSPLNRIDIQDSSHTFTCFSAQEKKTLQINKKRTDFSIIFTKLLTRKLLITKLLLWLNERLTKEKYLSKFKKLVRKKIHKINFFSCILKPENLSKCFLRWKNRLTLSIKS